MNDTLDPDAVTEIERVPWAAVQMATLRTWRR